MSFENIEINSPNFCIGPQSGTFCFVDTSDLNNAFLRVKNNSGTLIRSYTFSPHDIFYTDLSTYPYKQVVDLKYIGPKNGASFYSGAVFYTLERIIVGKYKVDDTEYKEYSDRCIIRKWLLDEDTFSLSLANTWYKISDADYYFDSFTISIQSYDLHFSESTTNNTGEIKVDVADTLQVNDVLMLGPSTDNDNFNKTEYVIIKAISGTTLTIIAEDGSIPTKYEYVAGDAITTLGNIYLFSNARPVFGSGSTGAPNVGTGSDGDVIINNPNTIVNSYSYVTQNEIPTNIHYVEVAEPNLFSVGEEVLLHQVQDYTSSNAGLYEFAIISNITNNTLTFEAPLVNSYKSNLPDRTEACVLQVVSVPNYNNLTLKVNAGIISKSWDGYSGGIVVFRVKGECLFEENSLGVDVSNTGYRGGSDNGGGNNSPGNPGESYNGLGWVNNSGISNCNPNNTGGGGGYGPSGYDGTAGAGGGSRLAGENAEDYYTNIPALAQGGVAFSLTPGESLIFGGGGGGGGDDDNLTLGVCRGGNGAGVILIEAFIITNAFLLANGEHGTDAGGVSAGTGGGGAGGTIHVKAISYNEHSSSAEGGLGGTHPTDYAGKGGDGFLLVPSISSNILSGFADNGHLYVLDQNNYCTVVDEDENAKYTSVLASIWNNVTGGLSFVRVNTYMTLDINDNYENIKSQVIRTVTRDFTILNVFAIDYIGTDIYLLQDKMIKVDDDGIEAVIHWSSYNYTVTTLIPFNFSTNCKIYRNILQQSSQVSLDISVRDQFNNGVYGSNVFVSYQGDPSAILDPISGYVISDTNGNCSVTYKASSFYTGNTVFSIRADKGSSESGSNYTHNNYSIVQYDKYNSFCKFTCIELSVEKNISMSQVLISEASINIRGYSKFIFGVGHYKGEYIEYDYNSNLFSYFNAIFSLHKFNIHLIKQVFVPLLTGDRYDPQTKPYGYIFEEQLNIEKYTHLLSSDIPDDLLLLPQLSSSRHLHDLNLDTTSINQYVFIQDALPAFWSEKITVNTSIWIRLRPFAYSLDPATLVFEVKEVNETLHIDTGYYNVTSLGTITLFDAGGGMYGIDFLYQPQDLFKNESVIHVRLQVFDTAPVPNKLYIEYWFKIIDDYKSPVVYNVKPGRNVEVPLNTPISFDITDYGIGLNIDDIEVFVNDTSINYSYTKLNKNTYRISYETIGLYTYGSTISVNVKATDLSKHLNTLIDYWTVTFKESTGPWVNTDHTLPVKCARGIRTSENNLIFQIYAIDNTGLDKNSVSVQVDGKDFTDKFILLPIIYYKS